MRWIELTQRTDEWQAWRKAGITATESAVILGLSPYKTAWRLWNEKTGRLAPEDLSANPQVRYGVEHEDDARQLFEERHATAVLPACGECDDAPLFRASFDGLTTEGEPVEIKCPSESTLALVRSQGLESDAVRLYSVQVQHQLLVSGASHGWLVFYDGPQRDLIEFRLERDEAVIERIRREGLAFWEKVLTDEEPEKDVERDVWVPRDAKEAALWQQLAYDYQSVQSELDALREKAQVLDEEKKRVRDALIAMMGDFKRADFAGVAVTERRTTGSVDYRRFLAERGIQASDADLAPYRGKGARSWLVRVTDSTLPKGFTEVDEELEAALAQPVSDAMWF